MSRCCELEGTSGNDIATELECTPDTLRWVYLCRAPSEEHSAEDVGRVALLGLLNNFIIHKISDSAVISRMQKSIGSIDASLWNRVPRLAPGQALASFASFARPLMVAIDPAPCKRLLVD